MSVETETSACFKSAEMPQAHSLIKVQKFSPRCLCLNLSHGASGKGALFFSPFPRTVPPGNATDGLGLVSPGPRNLPALSAYFIKLTVFDSLEFSS